MLIGNCPGDFVIGVTAVDRDTGNNGKVVYSLEDADNHFVIISETGVIIAAQRLNGDGGSYTFRVRASDLVGLGCWVFGGVLGLSLRKRLRSGERERGGGCV